MTTPSATPALAPLPPGLSAWTLEDEPTLARLLRAAPRGDDDVIDPALFGALAEQSLIELRAGEAGDGSPVLYPLVATRGTLMSAMYSIPLEQAWALLPATERLVPVRVTPRRAAISFFAAHVCRSSLGPYHELGVALPVVLDAVRPPSPLPPALWRDPSLGIYAVDLPVDSELRAASGEQLCGLPYVLGDAELELEGLDGHAHFALDGRTIADLGVRSTRWARLRRHDLSVQIYSLRAGRIVRSRYTVVGEGYRGRRGDASVVLGDHRRAQRLARLELSRRPLELQLMSRVNWIGSPPEDVGTV
jgi:hypothetical protein